MTESQQATEPTEQQTDPINEPVEPIVPRMLEVHYDHLFYVDQGVTLPLSRVYITPSLTRVTVESGVNFLPTSSLEALRNDPNALLAIKEGFIKIIDPEVTPEPEPDLLAKVTSLDPSSAPIGSPNFTLKVLGTNFTADTFIMFNDGEEPIIFVSDTEVTTIVKPSMVAVPIEVQVGVKNQNTLSNTMTFNFSESTGEPVPDPVTLADPVIIEFKFDPTEPDPTLQIDFVIDPLVTSYTIAIAVDGTNVPEFGKTVVNASTASPVYVFDELPDGIYVATLTAIGDGTLYLDSNPVESAELTLDTAALPE